MSDETHEVARKDVKRRSKPIDDREEAYEHIGRFTVLDKIAAGGMGVVFAAHDEQLDRKVAIKILHGRENRNEEAYGRMMREARAMARLSHPNVVQVHDVGRLRLPREEPAADGQEALEVVGHEELGAARARGAQQPAGGEEGGGRARGRRRRVYQRHARERLPDGVAQQGKVGTTEDERVGSSAQRREVALGGEASDVAGRPALLGERHEQGAGHPADPGVGAPRRDARRVLAAADGPLGADDADVTGARRAQGRLDPGLDHAEDGHVERLPGELERVERPGRGGVAGDDERLDPAGVQVAGHAARVADDRLGAARAVGDAGGVAEVEQVLVRQGLRDGGEHGQPADAGVEDANGEFVAGHRAAPRRGAGGRSRGGS